MNRSPRDPALRAAVVVDTSVIRADLERWQRSGLAAYRGRPSEDIEDLVADLEATRDENEKLTNVLLVMREMLP